MQQPVPDSLALCERIATFVRGKGLDIQTPFDSDWRKSGVYAVLDCVFSSMAKFESVVQPTLQRFEERSGLRDTPELTFSEFLAYMREDSEGRPSVERFAFIAAEIFGNRQKIAGRLKAEVAYDVCEFFVHNGYETKANLQRLMEFSETEKRSSLEILVMDRLAGGKPGPDKVRGIGLALGAYLLICLGDTSYVKPDTLLLRRVGEIGEWSPRPGNTTDFQLIRQAITCAGQELGIRPAHLEYLLWKYESQRQK